MIENKRLGLIAEQTADAVIIHDEKMNISFWNSSAQRIFGYKKKEVLGKPANLIVPKSLKKEFDKNLSLMQKNKFIHDFETKRIAKNGKLIDVSISASPLIDPKTKKLIGDIVSMRDITERILAKKSLDELEKNRKLTTIIQEHIEDERRSLARELHDELGQYVSAIKIFAQNISKSGKESEIILESFGANLQYKSKDVDLVFLDNISVKNTSRKVNDKEEIININDLFNKTYRDLINLSEKKYIPIPIYVKTF